MVECIFLIPKEMYSIHKVVSLNNQRCRKSYIQLFCIAALFIMAKTKLKKKKNKQKEKEPNCSLAREKV